MEPSIDIPAAPPAPDGTLTPLAPQQMTPATCPTCGSGAPYSFVFAVGRIEPRFPSPGVERNSPRSLPGHRPRGRPTAR